MDLQALIHSILGAGRSPDLPPVSLPTPAPAAPQVPPNGPMTGIGAVVGAPVYQRETLPSEALEGRVNSHARGMFAKHNNSGVAGRIGDFLYTLLGQQALPRAQALDANRLKLEGGQYDNDLAEEKARRAVRDGRFDDQELGGNIIRRDDAGNYSQVYDGPDKWGNVSQAKDIQLLDRRDAILNSGRPLTQEDVEELQYIDRAISGFNNSERVLRQKHNYKVGEIGAQTEGRIANTHAAGDEARNTAFVRGDVQQNVDNNRIRTTAATRPQQAGDTRIGRYTEPGTGITYEYAKVGNRYMRRRVM